MEKWAYLWYVREIFPLMGLLSGFFMIYYTNVVGLEPAALATLFLISKVVDGISDPIMGYFLDKFPVTKWENFAYDYSGNNHLCYKLYFTVVWRSLDSGRKICDCVCDVSAAGLDV